MPNRKRRASSISPSRKPVPLQEYYGSDYELSDVEQEENTYLTEEQFSVMLKRKRTIRNSTLITQQNFNMYGQTSLAQCFINNGLKKALTLVNKELVLKDIAFDSQARILHKKTEDKRAAEIALLQAK